MKYLYTLLLSLSVISAAAQQATVKGKVLDAESREGEIGAIIQFIDPSAGKAVAFTSAGEDGSFAQSVKCCRQYTIQVSNLGRKTIEKTIQLDKEDLDLGELLMESDENQLDAATVTTQRTLVKMEVDKMSYDVEGDVDSKSLTVLDMLRKVPMVTVDAQDNITVNGSGSFLVTVDGKPNQMLSKNASTVFKMMPASSIKGIEVVTNPGVKYDAEGVGGVLNLITGAAAGSSSAIADGQYGSLSMTAGTSQNHLGGMFTMQKGKFSMSVNGNIGYQHMSGLDLDTEIATTGTNSSVNKTSGTIKQKSPFAWGELSMSYEPDTLNLFSVNSGLMYYNHTQKSLTSTFAGLAGADLALLYTNDSKTRERKNDINIGADWQHKFAGSTDKTLTISYRGGFEPGKSWSRGFFNPESALLPSRENDGNTKSDEHVFQADYTMPAGKGGKLSTGVKFTYRKNSSVEDLFLRTSGSGAFTPDAASAVDYSYENKIGAAYLEYTLNVGKFGFKTGARYEYTWQDVAYKKGNGQDYSTKYGFLVPTASLQYSISPIQNIGLSYNMRINRPGIGYLNPFVNTADPTHISFGNPDLDVAKSHNLSLVYNFYSPVIMFNATLRHSRTNNGISDYTYTEDNVLYTTYGNIVKTQTTGLSLFGNLNLGKTSRIYANVSIDYNDMRSSRLGYKSGHWSASAFAGAQQTIFWDLRLSENVILSPKSYTLQGWNSGFQAGVISVAKSFLNESLTVTVTGISPFSGKNATFKSVSKGNGYTMTNKVKVPIMQAMVSLNWNFGKMGSARVKKADRSIEKDDIMDKPAANEGAANGNISTGM